VTAALQTARNNIDKYHSQWFCSVEEMCAAVDIEPSMPRTCGRQIHRSNITAENPTVFYKRSITIPLLDHLLSELGSYMVQPTSENSFDWNVHCSLYTCHTPC